MKSSLLIFFLMPCLLMAKSSSIFLTNNNIGEGDSLQILLVGPNPIVLQCGDDYYEFGAIVSEHPELNSQIEIYCCEVCLCRAGIGSVYYSLQTPNGDILTAERLVFIQESDSEECAPFLSCDCITDYGYCNKKTVCDVIVDIENYDSQVDFHIFPNPSNGHFTLEYVPTQYSNLLMRVFDIGGQEIQGWEEQVDAYNLVQKELDLSDWNKGIYFIKVSDGKNTTCRKVMIE